MDILALFFTVIVGILAALVGLALFVPFLGVVVRFRSNYTPKGLHLGGEDTEATAQQLSQDPRVGPVVNSLWAMFWRVRRIEGWMGLFKGYMPNLLETLVYTLIATAWLGAPSHHSRGQYTIPPGRFLRIFLYAAITSLLTIPFTILINRSITTPHKLRWFAPFNSLRILLTPHEFRRPWVLFFTPGLYAARFIHIFWIVIIARLVRILLIPNFSPDAMDNDESPFKDVSTIRLSFFLAFSALSTLVLSPLEVIATRLSIQRNHSTDSSANEIDAEYAGEDEDVIGLRSEEDPYVGLVDCGKRMIDEEGFASLYRAWWLTMIGAVLMGLR